MKLLRSIPALALVIAAVLMVSAQTGVTAEAVGQANVRSQPNVNGELLGEIRAGTRYNVSGRSQFVPWLLLIDPATNQPLGWVFQDLVTVQGDLNSVPFTEETVIPGAQPPAILPTASPNDPALTGGVSPTQEFVIVNGIPIPVEQATAFYAPPTATPITASVIGRVLGEINLRYGPGVDFERVGVARAGDVLPIVARHTQVTWVQIAYAASPNGLAWVAQDLLEIDGNLDTLPEISTFTFNLPTLTPTPSAVDRGQVGAVPLSRPFVELGASIYERMLASNFDPATSRLGAFFLMNLQTGEALAVGDEITFSGASLNKIAIVTALFGSIDTLPNDPTANMIAEAMVCSENISSNRMLSVVGDGNPFVGAGRVSDFLTQAGFERTFLYTPFDNDPFITPQAPLMPAERFNSGANSPVNPDPYNQMSVTEMGLLLAALYDCAYSDSGALIDNFDGNFTPTECRQILDIMTHNRIGNFTEAGVPSGVPVSHKHGWINDTHGDAALIRSPGGDFVFVIMLHNPSWLLFDESAFVIEEATRDIYNYFNPDEPLAQTREADVPDTCSLTNPDIWTVLLNPPY